jgi:ribonuclease P protein component
MALAKKYRLGKSELERVFKKGKTVKSSFFFIKMLDNEVGYPRLAVIVPAKIFKKAILRNRIKRIISDSFKGKIFLLKQFDVTVSATANILGKSSVEIKSEFEMTIDKIFVK